MSISEHRELLQMCSPCFDNLKFRNSKRSALAFFSNNTHLVLLFHFYQFALIERKDFFPFCQANVVCFFSVHFVGFCLIIQLMFINGFMFDYCTQFSHLSNPVTLTPIFIIIIRLCTATIGRIGCTHKRHASHYEVYSALRRCQCCCLCCTLS